VTKLENVQVVNYSVYTLKQLLNGNNGLLLILTLNNTDLSQWRSQDLEVGAHGVWGTEVPQRGPVAEPLVGGSGA